MNTEVLIQQLLIEKSYKIVFYVHRYYKLFLINIDSNSSNISDPLLKSFVNDNCLFGDINRTILRDTNVFKSILLKNSKDLMVKSTNEKLNVSKEENLPVFLQLISPEYSIPLYSVNNYPGEGDLLVRERAFYELSSGSFAANALKLDEDQINIINKIDIGNFLMLACAGSGKSVLMVSKCFNIANKHSENNFLITCFNKNLADYYNWRINVAGFRERNVLCSTFHKLIQILLTDAGIRFQLPLNGFSGRIGAEPVK